MPEQAWGRAVPEGQPIVANSLLARARSALMLLCLGLLLLAGCGGEGSSESPPTESPPPPSADRVEFVRAHARSVLPTGDVTFTVFPELDDKTEQAVCTLNGTPMSPCMLKASKVGRIEYWSLPVGTYTLQVEIRRRSDDTLLTRQSRTLEIVRPDVVVFSATPGGISAAITAARAGRKVAILEPSQWVGGMMSGGLTKTDVGPRGTEIIGGFANEFFQRVRGVEAQRGACLAPCNGLYDFEPQVAERVFEELLAEANVIVDRNIDLYDVRKEGPQITSLVTSGGEVSADMFIDASYEGDLMAMAGVPYALGREPRVKATAPDDAAALALQEDHAGIGGGSTAPYRVPQGTYVDPYIVPGDPSTGTLPYIEPRPEPTPRAGAGDSRVMAYTYRLCVTDDPSNRTPFTPPADYDPTQYEAHARLAQGLAEQKHVDLAVHMFNPAATVRSTNPAYFKYDLNGGSTFSIDMTAPHLNQAYVLATEGERAKIRDTYQSYIRGLLYFWQTDPRFGGLNEKVGRFGFCKDEFTDRGGWPHQLYIREARRMLGEYVMNENDVMQNGRRPPITDPVGFGSYNVDVHTVRYHAGTVDWPDGSRRDAIVLEGFLIAHLPDDAPYPVSYRSLVPRAEDATNLLNPVTLSATHIAYSALRMEPTFMILGQAAGAAAALAIEQQQSVQAVNYNTLRQRLLAGGQLLP